MFIIPNMLGDTSEGWGGGVTLKANSSPVIFTFIIIIVY